jgi:DNA-directed RNA polymerase specialized sigma subunit
MMYGGQKRQGKKDEIILSHISYEDKEWQPSITYSNEMERVYLRVAIHKLKRSYRRIAIMYYGLQMTCPEIGKVEGVSGQCVRQKLGRILYLLKSATGLRVGGV